MAQAILRFTNGVETFDLKDMGRHFNLDGGHRVSSGQLQLRILFANVDSPQSFEQLESDINDLNILLLHTALQRQHAGARSWRMEARQEDGPALTTWHLYGGSVDLPAPWQVDYTKARMVEATLTIDTEAYGRSEPVDALQGVTLLAVNAGLTHKCVATGATDNSTNGTVQGSNMVGLTEGSLWQKTRLAETVSSQTPAINNALMWGNTDLPFDRIIMGLGTAGAGSYDGVFEYSKAAGWGTLVPTRNDFRTNFQWDTPRPLGEIVFDVPTDFATKAITVNGVSVTAYWVRWVMRTFTNMTTIPSLVNGPVRSHAGYGFIPKSMVRGDERADGLIGLVNATGTAIAAVQGAVAVGLASDVMPPFKIDFEAATAFVAKTANGDDTNTAVVADANASGDEYLAVTLSAAFADAAQNFDGSTQSANASVGTTDKVGILGASTSFYIEAMIKPSAMPSDPVSLLDRWSGTPASALWHAGFEDRKVRFLAYNSGSSRRSVLGSSEIETDEFTMVTYEFDSPAQSLRVYVNAEQQASKGFGRTAMRSALTTALTLADTPGWTSGDSLHGNTAVKFAGAVSYILVQKGTVRDKYPDGYEMPTAKRVADANTVLLYEMEDNLGTTAIVDTGSGTAKPLARTGFTNANTKPGYFAGGVGGVAKVAGLNLSQCFAEQYRGTYRVLLSISTLGVSIASISDILFALQFNVGDLNFPLMGVPIPLLTANATANDWQVLDMGTITLPQIAMPVSSDGSGSARNGLECYLFIQHAFASSTTIGVDCLYMLPLHVWSGMWESFPAERNSDYISSRSIAQNAGIAFDGRGPQHIIYPFSSAGWNSSLQSYTRTRNPNQDWDAVRPGFVPRVNHWLFAMPLRGVAVSGRDYLARYAADQLSARVQIHPRWNRLAAA